MYAGLAREFLAKAVAGHAAWAQKADAASADTDLRALAELCCVGSVADVLDEGRLAAVKALLLEAVSKGERSVSPAVVTAGSEAGGDE